jgi:hypothetical protein
MSYNNDLAGPKAVPVRSLAACSLRYMEPYLYLAL